MVMAAACDLPEEDPVALLAERAGASVDRGAATASDDAPANPAWARACAMAARGRGETFRVLVDQPLADARAAVGWIGEPAGGGWRLDYAASDGLDLGDSECVRWTACAAIVDRGLDCGSLGGELCLRGARCAEGCAR
ncbi:MAG: hypothetical protein IPL61_21915 [Myxococcales bacterium]|nr:hypothetical protein [Myxococcales bacterium]